MAKLDKNTLRNAGILQWSDIEKSIMEVAYDQEIGSPISNTC
jgi:hypothetical protein